MDPELHKKIDEGNHGRPVAPVAGIVYGDIIYWLTIAATCVVLVGSIVTFTTLNNHINPNDLLSAIWQGKDVEHIWLSFVGEQPDGHWYLEHIHTGNGLTASGIALGVFSVIPGILGAAFVLFREKEYLFGALAVIAAIITIVSVVS
ncbi:MAG: hypothetical protein PVG89_14635 [Gammaproteobacteria bacterium]|jgi:hypothetical protein